MEFSVRSLRFRYPAQETRALDGIDLDIPSRQVIWFTGALGSGTSTLLSVLAGLAPRLTGGVREGMVTADGIDVASRSPLDLGIAYLGPSPPLQLSGIAATVRDEVAVGPMNLGRTQAQIIALTDSAIDRMQLHGLVDRAPGALSGGETQRVLIASLLAAAPRAWILDEPFSALDHAGAQQVAALLRREANRGATVIVACDDADAMLPIADRVIVLSAGRIVLDGAPTDVLAGEPILQAGAGTTDAASLAFAAAMPAPWPLTREALLGAIGLPEVPPQVDAFSIHAAGGGPHHASPSPVLRLAGVRFRYRADQHQVLDQIDLRLAAGEAIGLFGPNGAGKSTLLRLAMALEHPDEGIVETLGLNTAGLRPEDLAPGVGFLFQQPDRQLFATSVRKECALAPRIAGWSESRVSSATEEVLIALGLADTAEEHPYDLPLARRRLVALATILTADPRFVLLDEPTAGLDAASRERVIDVIRAMTRRGVTVLAITHDAGFAHEALDRGVLLDDGRVIADGPVRAIIDDRRLRRPAALVVAQALGLAPGHDRRADVADALKRRY